MARSEKAAAVKVAAGQEEADGYYEAGRAFLYGLDGQEINYTEAYTNFEKALELGKTEANFYLGVLCDWYSYPERDYGRAREYYEADSDNPYAQLSLGILYRCGQGLEKDAEKAQEIFDAVIEAGCVEGYLGSGYIAYDNEDYDTALECYNKVLDGNEQLYIAAAMNEIAYMHQHGHGVRQDYAQAMEWYEKAADLGNTDAMTNVGYMYQHGYGVERDYTAAVEWYRKAVDLGNVAAMNNIGYMYMEGYGVKQNYSVALKWFVKAANLGDTIAMTNIGYMYESGRGVEQDAAMAAEWYEKAGY